jgi:heptosyltransferase-2
MTSLDNSPAILIVGPTWVGDMVMAQSLFKLLKRRHPHCWIDVLAPDWSRELLERMTEVRDAVTLSLGHGQLGLAARYRLACALRPADYRQAIVLPNSFKSALIPYWAKIPRRTGFVGEFRYPLLNDARRLDKLVLLRTVDRFLALGLDAGEKIPQNPPHPRLEVSYWHVGQALARLELAKPDKLLALCPGAEYGPAKRWPETYFAEIARRKIAEGWQVWLFGSEKDAAVGAAIHTLAGSPACVNLCGRTRLGEAVDLLSLADAVVSNDSGLMHVAAALDRPLVALFGSSDPGFTPPLSEHTRILSLRLPCSPCFKRECPKKHLRCLRDLNPESVLEALAELGENQADFREGK